MAKGGNVLIILVFCVIVAGIFFYISSLPPSTTDATTNGVNVPAQNLLNGLTIASWNLQIFGQDKASDASLMAKYANVIGKYDIVFVQEIRDISETSFNKLCALLPGYSCLTSSRAGRSTSKESFGIIYRKGVLVLEWTDYNSASGYQQQFERPPVKAIIQIASMLDNETIIKNLTIWENHIKPDDVINEMTYLEQIVIRDTTANQPWVVLGDLNFDCTYADHNTFQPFNSYLWVIPDTADTTVGTTDCAYDRMISNFGVSEYGIDTSITEDMSDHRLVWIKI
jgi:endonuclease/exonuclease/phosphatase family metal-dependent hydrolase